MWPHTRVAWWDVKRWLAMRGRRIAAGVALTTLAGSGVAAYQYYGSQPTAGSVAGDSQPAPAVDPTIPWDAPAAGPDPGVAAPPPTTNPTFVSPTQPWPGTNP
jgi:hypothetical protein